MNLCVNIALLIQFVFFFDSKEVGMRKMFRLIEKSNEKISYLRRKMEQDPLMKKRGKITKEKCSQEENVEKIHCIEASKCGYREKRPETSDASKGSLGE